MDPEYANRALRMRIKEEQRKKTLVREKEYDNLYSKPPIHPPKYVECCICHKKLDGQTANYCHQCTKPYCNKCGQAELCNTHFEQLSVNIQKRITHLDSQRKGSIIYDILFVLLFLISYIGHQPAPASYISRSASPFLCSDCKIRLCINCFHHGYCKYHYETHFDSERNSISSDVIKKNEKKKRKDLINFRIATSVFSLIICVLFNLFI